MPGKAAKVVISERQQAILLQFSRGRLTPKRLGQRADILLLAFQSLDNEAIAELVGLQRHQVGFWRKRWQKAFANLIRIECLQEPSALKKAIAELLSDQPRSGCPGKFTPEQVALIVAVACEEPQLSGRPITHWTNAELADEACQRGIVDAISPSQVGRFLPEAQLQPHRSRYWLFSKEKDEDLFNAQVYLVCATYLDAPGLYFQHNTHTISTDEMTGIQALQRIAPGLPMRPGQMQLREYEYKRHGTLTLIGNLHVVTGELVARNGIFSIPRSPPSRRCMKKPGKIGVSSRAPPEKRSQIRKPYVLAGLIRIGDPKVAVPSCFQGFFIYLDSPMLGASWRKYHFVVASTVGPTRTEEDFVKHIEQTVALDPQAGYVFVVDNLNIHQSATLVEWVAQRCGIDEDLGKKGSRGILKSQKTRQEFLSEQSHRIRFVYTPKHSSWLNQIEVIFGVVMGKVIRRGNFTSVEDLRSKLLAFIDYFNAVFAKPFKWTYTGRPLAA